MEQLADDCIATEKQMANYLEALLIENNNIAKELFEFRKFFLDSRDFEKIAPYETIDDADFRTTHSQDRQSIF